MYTTNKHITTLLLRSRVKKIAWSVRQWYGHWRVKKIELLFNWSKTGFTIFDIKSPYDSPHIQKLNITSTQSDVYTTKLPNFYLMLVFFTSFLTIFLSLHTFSNALTDLCRPLYKRFYKWYEGIHWEGKKKGTLYQMSCTLVQPRPPQCSNSFKHSFSKVFAKFDKTSKNSGKKIIWREIRSYGLDK